MTNCHQLKLKYKYKTVTNCNTLKLKAEDGKYRSTDVVDIEGMFRIIESIPSKNAEPIKKWLAKLGSERINEIFDPSIIVQRAIDIYRVKGYDEEWIAKRTKCIQDRKKLVDVWMNGGISDNVEFSILTNEIYKEWSGMAAKGYKEFKGLRKESLREKMSDMEVALADISEIATRELVKEKGSIGLEDNKRIAKIGEHTAKVTRDYFEEQLRKSVVTNENKIKYQYINEKEIKNK